MIQLLSERDIVSILRIVKDERSPFSSISIDRPAVGMWIAQHVDSVPAHDSPSRVVMLQAVGVVGETIVFRHVFHSRRNRSLQEFFDRTERSICEGKDGEKRHKLPHWFVLSVGAATSYAVSRDIFVAELTD